MRDASMNMQDSPGGGTSGFSDTGRDWWSDWQHCQYSELLLLDQHFAKVTSLDYPANRALASDRLNPLIGPRIDVLRDFRSRGVSCT